MIDPSEIGARFSAAASRYVRANAPVAALIFQQAKQSDPSTSLTSAEVVKNSLNSIVHRFMTADGNVSVAEGLVIDAVMLGGGMAATAEALGGLKSGQIYDLLVKMGSNAEQIATTGVRVLSVLAGKEAAEEFVAAAIELATATCDLDGRSHAEDEAVAAFEELLRAAVPATD